MRLRRFVCLFCVKTESKCSQTCLSRAQTAREQSSSSCRFVMLRRNLATLNTGFGMRLDAEVNQTAVLSKLIQHSTDLS